MNITIPDNEWEQVGDDDDPAARLLAVLTINGCNMHLEAYAVLQGERRSGVEVEDPEQEYLDAPQWVVEALGASADYEPVVAAPIAGREYVLIATPYQL